MRRSCVVLISALLMAGAAGPVSRAEAHLQANIDDHQGFDRCGTMSTGELEAFWAGTSLYTVGIYIGGETAQRVGCFLPDRSWVDAVRNQGWGIVFIWDGLQAPCSRNTYRMSYDTNIAYNQGVDAATRAFIRLTDLGVDEVGSVEYVDIEYYDSSNTPCRNAVNAFLLGWADRLAALGDRSGVYSSSSAAIRGLILGACWNARCPDNVRMARWCSSTQITAGTCVDTVWGDPYVADGYWYWHQRLRQYRGQHAHSFNGQSLYVDDDCNLGQVARAWGHDPSGHDPKTAHPECLGDAISHRF